MGQGLDIKGTRPTTTNLRPLAQRLHSYEQACGPWIVFILTATMTLWAVRSAYYPWSSVSDQRAYGDWQESAHPPILLFKDANGKGPAERYGTTTTLMRDLHILPSFIWAVGIPFQFYGGLQKTHPKWHRTLGYIIATISFVLGQSGPIACLMGACFNVRPGLRAFGDIFPLATIMTSFYGYALYRAIQFAKQGDIYRHRRWMKRHASIAYGNHLMRVIFMLEGARQTYRNQHVLDSYAKSTYFWRLSGFSLFACFAIVEFFLLVEDIAKGRPTMVDRFINNKKSVD